MILNDPNYTGGPIRLLACNTGACGATAAQNLANKLGVDVLAPNNLVWAFPNGTLMVTPTPTVGNVGFWLTFTPGGH